MSGPTYTQRELDQRLRRSLTAYVVTSAQTYSRGAWDGTGVAEDMLRSANIKPREIREIIDCPLARKRLQNLLRKP